METVRTFQAGELVPETGQAGRVLRYAVAFLAVAFALAVRLLLQPILGEAAPLLAFVPAVLVAAWYGGYGPGLLATVAGGLAGTWFFLPPHRGLGLELADIIHVGIFAFTGMTVSLLHSRLSSARARAALRLLELQEADDEIRKLAASLEQRVVQRTTELQAANQALEAFAYSISHDLRAPLRGIQGFAQALEEDYGSGLDATGQDYTRRISAAAERMDQLIQDILSYSRLSRAEIELAPVPLDAVVRDAGREIEPALRERAGALAVEDRLPEVLAHRPTLFQVLVNLMGNAILYVAPEVAPRIRVRAEERVGRVRLWIEDNGIGISPEHHERIFQVFERLHGSEAYPGTGIGLAIVRKGAERMGGSAGVESAPGEGSRFWIELGRSENRPHDKPEERNA